MKKKKPRWVKIKDIPKKSMVKMLENVCKNIEAGKPMIETHSRVTFIQT